MTVTHEPPRTARANGTNICYEIFGEAGAEPLVLRNVEAPTLVIHGTADPLVHPKAAQDTAVSIPSARLMTVQGMGHAIPIPTWPEIIGAIDKHAHGASAKAA